jgi:hypothetical protein
MSLTNNREKKIKHSFLYSKWNNITLNFFVNNLMVSIPSNDFLVVIIDINPVIWGSYQELNSEDFAPQISFNTFFNHTMEFLSSILINSEGNICIIASSPRRCSFVHSSSKKFVNIHEMGDIKAQLIKLVKEESLHAIKYSRVHSCLDGSLSCALCCLCLYYFLLLV